MRDKFPAIYREKSGCFHPDMVRMAYEANMSCLSYLSADYFVPVVEAVRLKKFLWRGFLRGMEWVLLEGVLVGGGVVFGGRLYY